MGQLASYEGPQSKRTPALRAWTELKKACPRLSDAAGDIADYGLHVGLPEGTTPVDQLARGYDARVIAIVTLRLKPSPKVIPARLASPRLASLALVSSETFSGIVAAEPTGRLLCELSPAGRVAMKRAQGIGDALDE